MRIGSTASALALLVVGACGGSVGSGPVADGGVTPSEGGASQGSEAAANDSPAPRAYAVATVMPGTLPDNGPALCMFEQETNFIVVGTPTAPLPTTIADGQTQGGAPVHVSCSVTAAGGGFDVNASVTLEGLNGGTLTITGHVTSSGGADLSASFTSTNNGTFSEANGCTVAYTGEPPPPQGMAVAAGRIWGHIDCELAQRSDELVPSPDGGARTPRTCDAVAVFLFEDCMQ